MIAELQLGIDISSHLHQLFDIAGPSLVPGTLAYLQRTWHSGNPPQPGRTEPCFLPLKSLQSAVRKFITPLMERPFGVNLIGHAFETFGIGNDIRMAARALQAVDVPFSVIHHPASNGASCLDRTLEPFICSDPEDGTYVFNLVCMAAPIQARWLRQVGFELLRNRYTIASWHWDTNNCPMSGCLCSMLLMSSGL